MCVWEEVKTITLLDEIEGNVLMISYKEKAGRAEVLNILFYIVQKSRPNLTRRDALSFIQEVRLTMSCKSLALLPRNDPSLRRSLTDSFYTHGQIFLQDKWVAHGTLQIGQLHETWHNIPWQLGMGMKNTFSDALQFWFTSSQIQLIQIQFDSFAFNRQVWEPF